MSDDPFSIGSQTTSSEEGGLGFSKQLGMEDLEKNTKTVLEGSK